MSIPVNGPALDGIEEKTLMELVDAIAKKVQAGEAVDVEACLAAHPDHADRLRRLLPAVAALAELGRSASAGEASVPPVAPDLHPDQGRLGDFRIVREVGRGGMGVVYEAEQISLGRRVALKVLPFAAALDARQLQRFHNEAQAAAHLHHTHIVPVHAVGCERGVHFYAMQFIEGHTLAALIRQLRHLAGLEGPVPNGGGGSAVALASHLASRGCPPAPPEPEPGPGAGPAPALPPPSCRAAPATATAPAAALPTEGSTRSPGFFRTAARLGLQAALALEHAHTEGVVHRDVKPANLLVDGAGRLWVTDFGLARFRGEAGLTLTGDLVGTLRYMSPEQALGQRHLVDHRTDVYSLGATLYEVLTLEPVHAGHDRQVLLRQIASEPPRPPRRLNPALPADLETVVLKALDKEPEARYATAQELADDLRRFLEDRPIRARRPSLWQRARKWARRHRPVVVSAAVLLALAVLALAVTSVLLTAAYRAEAEQRRRAEAKEQLAREAVDEMYTQVAEEWLAGQPDLQPVQRAFLLKALRFYQEFARDPRTEPAVRRKAGEAYQRVGAIQHQLGEHRQADEAYLRALALVGQLAADFPAVPEYREDLAGSYFGRGQLLTLTGRFPEALEAYARALALGEKLAADAPALPRHRHNLALCRHHLAILLRATARPVEAEQACRTALAALEKLAEDFPDEASHARRLAAGRRLLGAMHQDGKRLDQAQEALRQALPPLEKLVARSPSNPACLFDLANTQGGLAGLLLDARRIPEAEQAYLQARATYEKLVTGFSSVPAYRHALALCHDRLGFLHLRALRPREAEEDFRRARPVLEKLVEDFPDVAGYQAQLAELLQHLAALAEEGRDFEKAYRLVGQAIRHHQSALKANPRSRAFRQGLRTGYWIRAQILVRQGKHAEAARAAADLSRASFNAWQDLADAAEVLALCVPLAEKDAALPGPERQAAAQAYRARARKLLDEAIRAAGPDAHAQDTLAWLLAACPDPRLRDPPRAVALARQAVEREPEKPRHRGTLGLAYYRAGDWRAARAALEKAVAGGAGGEVSPWFVLAMAHWQLGEPDLARRWYDRACSRMRKEKLDARHVYDLRAEAGALLGLPPPADAPAEGVPPGGE
jgi:serine/threonine protein kinase